MKLLKGKRLEPVLSQDKSASAASPRPGPLEGDAACSVLQTEGPRRAVFRSSALYAVVWSDFGVFEAVHAQPIRPGAAAATACARAGEVVLNDPS